MLDGPPQKQGEEETVLGLALAEGARDHVYLGAVSSQDRTHELPRICPACYYSQIKSYFVGNVILTFEFSSQTEIVSTILFLRIFFILSEFGESFRQRLCFLIPFPLKFHLWQKHAGFPSVPLQTAL